jgi:hypothetical protein
MDESISLLINRVRLAETFTAPVGANGEGAR